MSSHGSDASNMLCADPSILSSNSDLDTHDVIICKSEFIYEGINADEVHSLPDTIDSFALSVIASHNLEDTFYIMDLGILKQLYQAWHSAMPRVEVSELFQLVLSDNVSYVRQPIKH